MDAKMLAGTDMYHISIPGLGPWLSLLILASTGIAPWRLKWLILSTHAEVLT